VLTKAQITKALVEKDYKHNRVTNPTKMDKKYAHGAKKAVADFMNKAVKKHREHEKKKRDRDAQKKAAAEKVNGSLAKVGSTTPPTKDVVEDDEDIQVSDDEMPDAEEDQAAIKRKRESATPATPIDFEEGISKKQKMDTPPPPPRPPPPPAQDDTIDGSATPTDEVPIQEPSPADTNGSAHKDFAEDVKINGHRSPMQLATPSTNGSGAHANGH